jgi:hypothetical protein
MTACLLPESRDVFFQLLSQTFSRLATEPVSIACSMTSLPSQAWQWIVGQVQQRLGVGGLSGHYAPGLLQEVR